MPLRTLLVIPFMGALIGGCTELLPVGYECPDRQRNCGADDPDPEAGPGMPERDAGPGRPEDDASLDAGAMGEGDAGSEVDAGSQVDAAAPDAAPVLLIRKPSFEPDDPSSFVDGILQLLDIQTVSPWEECLDPTPPQVRSIPRNPVTTLPDRELEPQVAADGNYFVQFSATFEIGGFGKLTQPLSREVNAGEEIVLTFQAAATAGNDELFVRILGSDSRCARDDAEQANPSQVLYESQVLTDDEGWSEHQAVLRPERPIRWITLTADTAGTFDFSLTSPQVFFDHIEEETPSSDDP